MTQDIEHRVLHNAALIIDGDQIAWVGPESRAPAADTRTDLGGRAVLPGWVDSHTHLVFDGDRTSEFEARMAGQSYSAGGIAVTTEATRRTNDERLASLVASRVAEAVSQGTTYVETKTGYGLTVEDELRSALAASQHVDEITYLGAHLVPDGVAPDSYVDLVCGDMLTQILPHVRWADVFCERGAFSADQATRVLSAARDAGLGLRVHGNQLGPGPGIGLAVEFGAASVDHCNFVSDGDLDALVGSWAGERGTVATVLPACDLSTRAPLAPARRLLDAGVPIAIASNCNPGTSYTTSMAFCVATAVLQMGLSVAEAVRAATFGGALALGREEGAGAVGSIAVGHRADIHVLNALSATHLAYRPGVPLTYAVWRAGKQVLPASHAAPPSQ